MTFLTATLLTITARSEIKETEEANGCRIERGVIWSPSMEREVRYFVVLPPAYLESTDRTFPVLYTLHGARAPYLAFSQMTPLRKALADHPMVVVGFDGDANSYYLDAKVETDPKSLFTTFFFEELMPYLDQQYRIDPERRGLTGFSMGGYGAFHYGLQKPEAFTSISGLSGAYWDYFGEDQAERGRVRQWLGDFESNPENYREVDFYTRLRALKASGGTFPPVYLACGTEDFILEQSRAMYRFLKDNDFTVEYHETEGGHNWPFWRDASSGVIEFHARHFE